MNKLTFAALSLSFGLALITKPQNLHAQHLQSFESASTDNWTYTASPARYNNIDTWADTTTIGTAGSTSISPAHATKFWAMLDLQGPNTADVSVVHSLTFSPIALATTGYNQISFKANVVGYDNPDSLYYMVAFDNGTSWTGLPKNLIKTAGSTTGWETTTIAIPTGATHARLRLIARQNGNEDWAGYDDVRLGVAQGLPTVSLISADTIVNEGNTSLIIRARLSAASTTEVRANLSLVAPLTSATLAADFNLPTSTQFVFAPNTLNQTIVLPLLEDAIQESSETVVLRLNSPVGATLGTRRQQTIWITDNDRSAPSAQNLIGMRFRNSYKVGTGTPNSAEISAYDPATKRLFVVNSLALKLHVLSMANLNSISEIQQINVATYGGGINSVAVRNGIVAVAIDSIVPQGRGKVVFFNTSGVFLKEVLVGSMPDMITFSPNGNLVLTANEGEPNNTYTIDPEGTVSVINIASGVANITQANVNTISFAGLNGQRAALISQGVRIFGPNATVAKDLEPEYITFSNDGQTAYVSCQENNALVRINLTNNSVIGIKSFGTKNHALAANSLDASDQSGAIFMANWPIQGLYQPDAIASYSVAGINYIVSANEGDAREYTVPGGGTGGYVEVKRLGDPSVVLDTNAFPLASALKNNTFLGRLNISLAHADTNNDGRLEQIFAYGSRSWSIWNATTGQQVFDSQDQIERITAADPVFGPLFNASHNSNAAKNRSDDKGPEPEGVAIGMINNKPYAFISLERIGGVLAYDISNPAAPVFDSYLNSRTLGTTQGGDLGAEGIMFIAANESPNDTALVVVSNEISSTISVYKINSSFVTSTGLKRKNSIFQAWPNPTTRTQGLHLAEPQALDIYDLAGRLMLQSPVSDHINLESLSPGAYMARNNEGKTFKLLIK